jgi:hypothetical protein
MASIAAFRSHPIRATSAALSAHAHPHAPIPGQQPRAQLVAARECLVAAASFGSGSRSAAVEPST